MYKLLIIEDNPIQLKSVLTFVDWDSFNITEIKTASNGREGLDLYYEFRPDIIISDIFMPVLDGIEMVKEIRSSDEDVKIIFISAYEDFRYAKEAINYNVDAYILKPINPFEFNKYIEQVVQSMKKYKKISADHLKTIRENFLYALSHNPNPEINREQLENLALDEYNAFMMISLKINEMPIDEFSNDTIHELLNCVKEELLKKIEGIVIVTSPATLQIFIYAKTIKPDELYNEIYVYTSEFVNKKSYKYGKISVGISELNSDLDMIYNLYSQSVLAVDNNCISAKESIDRNSTGLLLTGLKVDLDEIISVSSNFQNNVEDIMNKYFIQVDGNDTTLKTITLTFIIALQQILNEHNCDLRDILGVSVWEKVENFNTIQNPYQFAKNIILSVGEYIQYSQEDKYTKVAKNIKDYIDKNYKDIDNVGQIADFIGISTSHAKNIFKKSTGQTIFDYLLKKRMEEAKRLLSDPYIKVYEVCDKVGYTSKNYFTKIFKKYTGMTPYEFQKYSDK